MTPSKLSYVNGKNLHIGVYLYTILIL